MHALSNASLVGTQLQRKHQLVHHDNTTVAIRNETEDTYLNAVGVTGSSKNKKQYVIGYEYIQIVVVRHQ
jgi:hypothetical protein